ncbi:MAG: exonuclease domain-containing protein [Alphaproteobacteria bacterium]|nr:exonuclease domain-containing protein [Alphaproteobacteria bacterium]
MDFVSIDVETANANMASICSIGAVKFERGKIAGEWYSLIDPRDYFDDLNVSIHGIDPDMVRGAPTYAEASRTLYSMISNAVVVTHTHFDRVAIHQASNRWAVAEPTCMWLDSARVARRTWAECAKSGYGLADVCRLIGYNFQHHHALEDAKAAGHILLAAMQKTDLDLDGWLSRVRQPIDPSISSARAAIRRNGNPDGPLFGEVIVFTGELTILRREASDLAASVGCEVASGVTKKTTLLVVGDIDVQRLAGHEKSAKHRKAEELTSKGFPIRIIRETDFCELVALASAVELDEAVNRDL